MRIINSIYRRIQEKSIFGPWSMPSTQCLRTLEATTDRDGRLSPVCKLSVLAIDQPAPEDLFVVGDTLTEDGRIGKVTDVQGIVGLKPVMAERWTPVTAHLILKAGRLDSHRSARGERRGFTACQADRSDTRSRFVGRIGQTQSDPLVRRRGKSHCRGKIALGNSRTGTNKK